MKNTLIKELTPGEKNKESWQAKKGETVGFRTGVTWDAQKTEQSTMYEILGYL